MMRCQGSLFRWWNGRVDPRVRAYWILCSEITLETEDQAIGRRVSNGGAVVLCRELGICFFPWVGIRTVEVRNLVMFPKGLQKSAWLI